MIFYTYIFINFKEKLQLKAELHLISCGKRYVSLMQKKNDIKLIILGAQLICMLLVTISATIQGSVSSKTEIPATHRPVTGSNEFTQCPDNLMTLKVCDLNSNLVLT